MIESLITIGIAILACYCTLYLTIRDVTIATHEKLVWYIDEKFDDFGGAINGNCDIFRLNMSQFEIAEKLIQYQLPFVIENFSQNWTATTSWQKGHFQQLYGHRRIKHDSETSVVYNSGGVVVDSLDVNEYLTLLEQVHNTPTDAKSRNILANDLFVFDINILDFIPELVLDIEIPRLFHQWDNKDANDKKQTWHMLSLGPSHTGLPFHSHGQTWLSVLFGTKHWLLYPPGYGLPNSIGSQCHGLCSTSEFMTKYFPSLQQLYPSLYSLSNTNSISTVESYIQAMQDILLHSSTSVEYRPMYCKQRPGDLMYLPPLWSHLTYNQGETVAFGGQAMYPAQDRYAILSSRMLFNMRL